jgi:hypothetical protein
VDALDLKPLDRALLGPDLERRCRHRRARGDDQTEESGKEKAETTRTIHVEPNTF